MTRLGKMKVRVGIVVAFVMAVTLSSVVLAYLPPGTTVRVSTATDGTEWSDHAWNPALSADGQVVAFDIAPTEPGGTGGVSDVFLSDLRTGTTELVSRTPDGSPGDGPSSYPSLSADGRFVAFGSAASDLVPGDTNDAFDVFVLDRATGEMARVSLSHVGAELRGGHSAYPSISGDGRVVAFSSSATDAVPGKNNQCSGPMGQTTSCQDIFVRDLAAETTERVSVAGDGTQGNGASFDVVIGDEGRIVAFNSSASNLVPGDQNRTYDVFVHDRAEGTIERVSVATDGSEANNSSQFVAMSGDGRYVGFRSFSSNLAENEEVQTGHLFLHDRETESTERVSLTGAGAEADSVSNGISISGDGRFVAFHSWAENVAPGESTDGPDVFVLDRFTGATERVSVSDEGAPADSWSTDVSISADGRFVVFRSAGSNLVPGDTNDVWDIFLHDRGEATPAVTMELTEEGLRVEGRVRLPGQRISQGTDGIGDVPEAAAKLGMDIARGEVTYRPEDEDLHVRIIPTQMPSVRGPVDGPAAGTDVAVGGAGAAYALRFRIGEASYEATGSRLGGASEGETVSGFKLRRCDPTCGPPISLAGGIGAGRSDVTIAIPIALLDPGPVRDLSVVTRLLDGEERPGSQMDEMQLPDPPELAHGVRIGAGAEPGEVSWIGAEFDAGHFTTTVPSPADGDRIWAEMCVADRCTTALIGTI